MEKVHATLGPDDFRELTEMALERLAAHPEAGPRLARLGYVSRFVFPDLKLVLDVGPADSRKRKKGRHLDWAWGGAWRGPKAAVLVSLPSSVANRCAQGKANAGALVSRNEIVVTPLSDAFDRDAVLDLVPLLTPLSRDWVEEMKAEGFGKFVL